MSSKVCFFLVTHDARLALWPGWVQGTKHSAISCCKRARISYGTLVFVPWHDGRPEVRPMCWRRLLGRDIDESGRLRPTYSVRSTEYSYELCASHGMPLS